LQKYKTFFNPIAYEQETFIFETIVKPLLTLVGVLIEGLPALTPNAAFTKPPSHRHAELKDSSVSVVGAGRMDTHRDP
jgi:hypothetical protein